MPDMPQGVGFSVDGWGAPAEAISAPRPVSEAWWNAPRWNPRQVERTFTDALLQIGELSAADQQAFIREAWRQGALVESKKDDFLGRMAPGFILSFAGAGIAGLFGGEAATLADVAGSAATAGGDLAAVDAMAGLMPAGDITAATAALNGGGDMSIFTDASGAVDYNAMAQQDFMDFGPQGVQDLGESLNYAYGGEWFANGSASTWGSVNDIMGSVSKTIQGAGGALRSLGGLLRSNTQNSGGRIGSMPLLLLAGAVFLLLRA